MWMHSIHYPIALKPCSLTQNVGTDSKSATKR